MLDYTRDPPVYSFNQNVHDEHYAKLASAKQVDHHGEVAYEIEIPKAREGLRWFMHVLDMPYDLRRGEPRDFNDEEKALLMPFAYVLACLDGNAFEMCIPGYIGDAFALIKANCGGYTDEQVFDEMRSMLPKSPA
jgi:hypothetical protein